MTNMMFFDFFMVTRTTPGMGFMPSLEMALRAFFSPRVAPFS
jgi:hypothetical protein